MGNMPRIWILLAPALLAAAACSATPDDFGTDEGPSTDGTLSYVGKSVVQALRATQSGEEGKTWNLSLGNTLPAGFVKQVPFAETWGQANVTVAARCKAKEPACEPDFLLKRCTSDADCGGAGKCAALKATVAHRTAQPKSLCVGHSDALLDEVWSAITEAKESVDISSLTPPEGRFEATVRNAVTYASESANPARVRMLFGDFPGSFVSAQKTYDAVTRDIPASSRIDVSVAAVRDGVTSWNHSKIIVRDQRASLVGGVNLWDEHYLGKNPVHDTWIAVEGRAARDASRYLDELWGFACGKGNPIDSKEVVMRAQPQTQRCPAPLTRPTGNGAGGTPIIAAGRLGGMGANSSDQALVALFASARRSIRMSQQDIGPLKRAGLSFAGWPEEQMVAMIAAMARGVEVSIVLSNPKSVPGDVGAIQAIYNSYDNGWSLEEVGKKFIGVAEANRGVLGGKNPTALVCEKLKLMNLRMGAGETWPDGNTFANHAKSIIVDDRAFYLGSQNTYVANLAEFGYIVDDSRATETFIAEYQAKAEEASRRTAVSGPGVACRLR